MIDIAVFFIGGNRSSNYDQTLLINGNLFYQCRHVLNAKNNKNYCLNIEDVCIDSVPTQIDADIIIFLDDSLYIKEDLIDIAISHSSIFRDYGILCGPVKTDISSSNAIGAIYEYDLNFHGSRVSDITGESNNYPPIIGSMISGEAYNRLAYCPTISSRHKSFENYHFLEMLSKRFKIYYADSLNKYKKLTKKDLEIATISKMYYDDGYQSGRILFNMDSEQKTLEVWHRFVQSPESFDYNCPRWLMQQPSHKSAKQIEDLVILRCQYQIGFYEGMTNKTLI